MVKYIYVLFFSLVFLPISFVAAAQDKAETPQNSDTVKTEKRPPKQNDSAKKDSPKNGNMDLDAFFKKGEENAKTSRCDKPAKPADPIA